MSISIGGKTLKSAYIGDTPIKAIYVGSRQVWSAQRTVTVEYSEGTRSGSWSPVSGDFDLIDRAGSLLTMKAPVTCDGDMVLVNSGKFSAGTVIPAGSEFYPFYSSNRTYTFTEVI